MFEDEQFESWVGMPLEDVDGGRLGSVEGIYVDGDDGSAQWLLTKVGRFGGRYALVPIASAIETSGRVRVGYRRHEVHDSPTVRPGAVLVRSLEAEYCGHYGFASRARRLADLPAHEVSASPIGMPTGSAGRRVVAPPGRRPIIHA
jgi:hypothetical protein